jgi:hypothetical protein
MKNSIDLITTERDFLVEALCSFVPLGNLRLEALAQRPFRPSGLMLWDVPDSAKVTVSIGQNAQLNVVFDPIPCRWFSHFRSFAEVVRATADGLEPPAWGAWDAVHPGMLIRLTFSEPVPSAQALMWGHTVKF